MTPTWVQLVYLLCAICFILALKGLSGPRTARAGNLLGAGAAVVGCAVVFFYLDLEHIPLILAADRRGHGRWPGRRPARADDPDATDGGAVQRRRRRRGRPGGAARAGAHAGRGRLVRPRRDGVHHRGGLDLVLRLGDHLPQAAGADDVAAGGVPRPARRVRRCAGRRGRPVGPHRGVALDRRRRRARAGRPAGRRAARAAGRRRRRTHRHLAAQRLHRPDRRGRRLRPRQHPAARRRHARRRRRHVPHQADGGRDGPLGGQHPVRRAEGRLHARGGRGVRPAGEVRRRGGRRDPARLRPQGDHRARLRPRRRPGAAHPARARRRAGASGACRSTTRSTRSPAGCPAT